MRQFWTSSAVMPRYTRPVYVLTSKQTFSGGEECAYDLKTQKRASLVGETTGGEGEEAVAGSTLPTTCHGPQWPRRSKRPSR
ncbi:hypothetical protein EER27_11195 [Lysobacter psychrotolerans]|uniref:Tail specific protease domain-containing protein n=2 Tax=Montanilutibacter psychrotolerans TaxID=1327343 RepID=A0A3M8SP11_9GAMM|nr:hypothetical protein EER27_11195 [Lysobacter psychrotolerans]